MKLEHASKHSESERLLVHHGDSLQSMDHGIGQFGDYFGLVSCTGTTIAHAAIGLLLDSITLA